MTRHNCVRSWSVLYVSFYFKGVSPGPLTGGAEQKCVVYVWYYLHLFPPDGLIILFADP